VDVVGRDQGGPDERYRGEAEQPVAVVIAVGAEQEHQGDHH
jgi:hypothetical protein